MGLKLFLKWLFFGCVLTPFLLAVYPS